MKIPVLGMDPSFSNWGLMESMLDLETGVMDTPHLTVVSPEELKGKQVRVNSSDLHRAQQLAEIVMPAAKRAKVIFVEIPVGSQSARAMASYGICIGILSVIRSMGIPLIEVTPTEVKVASVGKKTATKREMISWALSEYPDANFPRHNGKLSEAKAEHVADAIAATHAGVRTNVFENLMRLFQNTQVNARI